MRKILLNICSFKFAFTWNVRTNTLSLTRRQIPNKMRGVCGGGRESQTQSMAQWSQVALERVLRASRVFESPTSRETLSKRCPACNMQQARRRATYTYFMLHRSVWSLCVFGGMGARPKLNYSNLIFRIGRRDQRKLLRISDRDGSLLEHRPIACAPVVRVPE